MSSSLTPENVLASVPRARSLRLGPLVRLLDTRLRGRLGAQLGKLCALALGLGTAIVMPFVARSTSGDGSTGLVLSALGWLSFFAAGAIAFSAAGSGAREEEAALAALARARGHTGRSIVLADALATARRIRRVVGAPALCLAILSFAFSRSISTLAARALLVCTVSAYVLVLSSLLAFLAYVAKAASPGRGRSLFVALVLLPHVLHWIFPQIPSVVSVCRFLLHQVALTGVAR